MFISLWHIQKRQYVTPFATKHRPSTKRPQPDRPRPHLGRNRVLAYGPVCFPHSGVSHVSASVRLKIQGHSARRVTSRVRQCHQLIKISEIKSETYTSRYIKIQQDTFSYGPLWIQLRYLYLIMYPSCIPHVSSMYPRTSADTCISYVSRINPACIPRARYMYLDVSHMYPNMYLGLVRDTCKIHAKYRARYQDTCILLECNRAFKIHLKYIRIHKGCMYPSVLQDTCRIQAGYIEIHQDTYPIGKHPQKG